MSEKSALQKVLSNLEDMEFVASENEHTDRADAFRQAAYMVRRMLQEVEARPVYLISFDNDETQSCGGGFETVVNVDEDTFMMLTKRIIIQKTFKKIKEGRL